MVAREVFNFQDQVTANPDTHLQTIVVFFPLLSYNVLVVKQPRHPMIYVQFYQKSAISDELIEGCSDRSVVILDGRNTRFTHNSIGEGECKKRGYLAWRLFSGESFLRSSPIDSLRHI